MSDEEQFSDSKNRAATETYLCYRGLGATQQAQKTNLRNADWSFAFKRGWKLRFMESKGGSKLIRN